MCVRMRGASLVLEIGKEPFHLRDHCELPSHTGLEAKPSDEHATEHITGVPCQSQVLHPNTGSLIYLKEKKKPLRQKNVML